MKRKLLFILAFVFAFLLIGCKENNDPNKEKDDDEKLALIATQLDEVQQKIISDVPTFVMDDIDLYDIYNGDGYTASIEWDSNNPDVLDFSGCVTPDRGKAIEVTLTYKIMIETIERSGTIDVIVTKYSLENVAQLFNDQFSNIINRDYTIKTKFFELYNVDWYSTNTEVFTNDGKYIKPLDDTMINIKYIVSCGDKRSEEYSREVKVVGITDLERITEVKKWFDNELLDDTYITEGVTLPTSYEKYGTTISWKSSNEDVISSTGEIRHFVYERYVTLTAFFKMENGSSGSKVFQCVVSPLDTSKMTDEEIVENFLSSIAVTNYKGVSFGYSECPNLSPTFGSIYFYTDDKKVDTGVTEMLIPVGTKNRSQIPMKPELVVIHDTANYNASALANAKYVQSGYSGSTTGWHYTTGNDGVYQTIPDNEVGYHANGTGSTLLTWIDTNIKATAKRPIVTVGDDKYIYINGIKTSIALPNPSFKLCDDGLLCEIGNNGNYMISTPWFCSSHGFNAVQGGNASGIGLESAVKKGDDYNLTVRITAKHVANLLIKHNLSIGRVVQHNTTSGKNCPQAIREANFWYTFKDIISMEKYAKENLKDYTFKWTSNSSIMDNSGDISKDFKGATSVQYSVVVTKGTNPFLEKSFTTNLIAD